MQDKEIMRMSNVNNIERIIGLGGLVAPFVILVPIGIILAHEFMFLSKYFDNALQWVNLLEIEKLRNYFFENTLVVELMQIIKYEKLLLSSVFMIIFSFGSAIYSLIAAKRDIIIYDDGILISEEPIKWDDILSFKWSDSFETKLKKEKCFYLYLTLKDDTSDLDCKTKLKVKHEFKDRVDNILKKYFKEIDEEVQLKFMPFPVISTKRLMLRKLKSEDKNEIFSIKSNEKVLEYLENKKYERIEEAEEYIKRINDGIADNKSIMWGIALKDNERMIIGTICLWNFNIEDKSAEVGYELMPEFHSKGIMDEALKSVVKYVFNFAKFKTLTAYTHKENLKSISLLKRNDFSLESEDESYLIFKLNKKRVSLRMGIYG